MDRPKYVFLSYLDVPVGKYELELSTEPFKVEGVKQNSANNCKVQIPTLQFQGVFMHGNVPSHIQVYL